MLFRSMMMMMMNDDDDDDDDIVVVVAVVVVVFVVVVDIDSGDRFQTDSNGLEFVERIRDYRST